MKIAFFALNQNFCGSILEELQRKHTVRVYKHSQDPSMNYANIVGLINWCDLIYCDFIQTPLPEISQMQFITKPIVTRMDGIDILSHVNVDWRNISALILMPVQEKRLIRLRSLWNQQHPDKPLTALPKKILRRNVGIDLKLFQPNYQRKMGYHIVLHASVIRDTKGVYEAIQSFYRLLEEDGDKPWELHLIGQWEGGWNWPQRQEYVMYTQELIETLDFPPGRFYLTPRNYTRSDWANYLKNKADFYWCFSHREGFPNSLGEGCASGIIPIMNWFYAADEIYPREWLCKSPSEIIEKTIEYGNLNEEDRKEFRRKVRRHIEQYSRRETAIKIRELCEEVFEE